VLTQVAERPAGSHHFYISFRSTGPATPADYLRQVSGRDDDRAAAPVLGLIIAPTFRGDGELQQAAGTHKGAVRRPVGLRRPLGALRPAVRSQGQAGHATETATPTPLPAPDKRPACAADAEASRPSRAPLDRRAKTEDAKVVKLDSFEE
jgi:hypothetical protein